MATAAAEYTADVQPLSAAQARALGPVEARELAAFAVSMGRRVRAAQLTVGAYVLATRPAGRVARAAHLVDTAGELGIGVAALKRWALAAEQYSAEPPAGGRLVAVAEQPRRGPRASTR